MEVVTELLLLQVLLGKVFKVSLGEGELGGDIDLGLVPGQSNLGAKVSGLAVHLDLVVEELLEVSNIKDRIGHGGAAVNDKLSDRCLLHAFLSFLCIKQTKMLQNCSQISLPRPSSNGD